MKLYTKTGDDGSTGLFGGGRVHKDDARIEAFGTVDELNSAIGLAQVAAAECEPIGRVLIEIQNRLFELGADLATPGSIKGSAVPRIGPEQIAQVETMIDQTWDPLPAMQHFVLPGGCELAARLHVARTICRRAERLCVTLATKEDLGPHVAVYLNRLSDLLFALARRANQLAGAPDVPWLGRG